MILSDHDMFRLLQGNPHSISLIAHCHANPQIPKKLHEVYKMLKNEEMQDFIGENEAPDMNFSLRISSEASVSLLKESSTESFSFLFFLGLLPGGVTDV